MGTQDANTLIQPLAAYLQARLPGARDLALQDAFEPSQGFSNKTVIFNAGWTQDGATRRQSYVARIQRETDCPMLADVLFQWRVMSGIAASSDVAVPPLVLAESDPAILGAPFYLMERVNGRATPDYPSHHVAGWFKDELTTEQRACAWWNGIREMARLHQIDWQKFPSLAKGAAEQPLAGFYIDNHIRPWFEWGSRGRAFPVLEEAIRRLKKNQPPAAHSGLAWNDARMGNTMFAPDLSVAALVDFEVASLGPAEIDLAQWLYMEDVFSILHNAKRLDGVPGRAEAIQGFEHIYGRPMVDFEYYEALNALKHAVIFLRSYGNDKETGAVANIHIDYATNRVSQYLSRTSL